MKYIFGLFSIIILNQKESFSQDETTGDIEPLVKLTILNPGISYEMPVAGSQSLYFYGYSTSLAGLGYSSSQGYYSYFLFDPALSVHYRYYYNRRRRESKGKRVEKNSQNYLGGVLQSLFTKRAITPNYYVENNRRPLITMGAMWGLQRNYRSHFSLDINLGLGYTFAKDKVIISGEKTTIDVSEFGVIGQITLGFWLNNK